MDNPLLSVRDLRISFHGAAGTFDAVRGVSFDLGREKLGIVGKSGSGKSMTGRAIMRLTPPAATVEAERIQLGEIDILRASEKTMDAIRGRRIGLIMQDPKYSLNPVVTVGEQIAEAYRIHARSSASEARQKAVAMLGAVQIRDPERVYRMYPHEMSGGMGQRIMIAMMLVSEPEILIADEATSALDVTVRLEILNLLNELVLKARARSDFHQPRSQSGPPLLRSRADHVSRPGGRNPQGKRTRPGDASLYEGLARCDAAHSCAAQATACPQA